MKKYIYILVSFVQMAAVWLPATAHGAAQVLPALAAAPMLITEVLPGSASSASEEFIELKNNTGAAVDMSSHTWELQVASSTATDWSAPLRTIVLSGVIPAGGYYVAASQYTSGGQAVQYLPAVASVWYTAGLSAAAGHIRLLYFAKQPASDGTCTPVPSVIDEVEWGIAKDATPAQAHSLDGRVPFLQDASAGIPAGSSLSRYHIQGTAVYADSEVDSIDFGLASPASPGAVNSGTFENASTDLLTPSVPFDGCVVPVPPGGAAAGGSQPGGSAGGAAGGDAGGAPSGGGDSTGASPGDAGQGSPAIGDAGAGTGLLPPQITELLPNPAPPQSDSTDEFIELYNPNASALDVGGYSLAVGTTTVHTYVFPAWTVLAPGSYRAFFSADTGLSLSNSGGQARLADAAGVAVSQSDIYGTAKEGQAWILDAGSWQWTDAPTPSAPNVAEAVATPETAVQAAETRVAATPKKASAAPAKSSAAAKPKAAAKSAAKPKKAAAKPGKTDTLVAG
ncbi:MAG TPA: lamin tail domain-containing protein, partial [Candidatus Saccharimonadales bacterium]|nr:lamin tail domain-containing protein [Candidatus Saccharimonadales bacterium]